MDGSDDGYESYLAFPLFYILGGSEEIHAMARRLWTAVTGSSPNSAPSPASSTAITTGCTTAKPTLFLHYFGLADPNYHIDRQRALKFAAMYMGEDPEAPNWDPEHKIIRSPINGGQGALL